MDSIQFAIHEKARQLGARKAPPDDNANVEWVRHMVGQTVRRFVTILSGEKPYALRQAEVPR